jgi:DMSO reductase anchor subunit
MVIGVVFAGVMSGMATAMVSVAAGHPIETTLMAYMTAGLIGSLSFVAIAARQEVDVLP